MNLLRNNPRITTLLMLALTFIYCSHFAVSLNRRFNFVEVNVVSTATGDSLENEGFSKNVNQFAQQISRRIEQAIRQTSHLIGS